MTGGGDVTKAPKSGAERQRSYKARRAAQAAAVAQARQDLVPTQPALFEPAAEEIRAADTGAGARWRQYVVQRFGSPLVARVKMASMSVPELAAFLGCDRLTAHREIGNALDAVIPFVHARAPNDPGEQPTTSLQVLISPRLASALDAEDGVDVAISGTWPAREVGDG